MVITKDSESFDPGSSPGRTFCPCRGGFPVFVATGPSNPVLVAQLDKASDYESEDWGFKSLQGYFFIFDARHEIAAWLAHCSTQKLPCLDARVV